jgi:hypothetical protein
MNANANRPGVNLLQDVVAVVYPLAASDDGTPISSQTPGTGITVWFDKISWEDSFETANHGAAQNPFPWNRITAYPQSAQFETKLQVNGTVSVAANLYKLLRSCVCARVTIATDPASGVPSKFEGLVKNLSGSLEMPSTLSFSLENYGSPVVVD